MEKKHITLIVIPLVILILSLFLMLRGPSFTIHEEVVPVTITRTVSVTLTTTIVYQTQVQRSQVLFSGYNLLIPAWGYRYSGPYHINIGRTLKVYWEADTSLNVYILNDVDWANRFFGAPTRWRASEVGQSGVLEYRVSYDEPLYVQVLCPTWCSAKLYRWEEIVEWIENVEVARIDTFIVPREEIEVINTTKRIEISSHYGFVLAILSGIILAIVVPLIIIKSRESGREKEVPYEEYDVSRYQSLLRELEKLRALQERLKTLYNSGKIGQEVYTRLNNELSVKITEIKDILLNERSVYERELAKIEEKIKELKEKVEELNARRTLGMIDETTFVKSIQRIESDLRKILRKKQNIQRVLQLLTPGE